jgi:hypothetical protein
MVEELILMLIIDLYKTPMIYKILSPIPTNDNPDLPSPYGCLGICPAGV